MQNQDPTSANPQRPAPNVAHSDHRPAGSLLSIRETAEGAIRECADPDQFVLGDVGRRCAEINHVTGAFATSVWTIDVFAASRSLDAFMRGWRSAVRHMEATRG